MKNLKWYAILLTITLAVSGCCPANVIAASAAETISVEEENAGADTAVADEEETDSASKAETAATGEEKTDSASEAEATAADEEKTDSASEAETTAADEEITDSASEAETIDADDKETESEETSEGDTTESETAEETSDRESPAEDEKEDASGQEDISDEEEPAEEESMIPEGGASSDEMFAAYVDNAFGIGGKDSRMLKARRPSAGSRLTGYDRAIYDYISSQLPLIESGERTETIFTLKISDMGLEKSEWTFAELNALGVATVVGEDGKLTAEAKQVIREQVNYDWDLVINALLADHPYLLYWYKKNASTYLTPYSLSKSSKSENPEENRVWLSGNCIAKLPVQEEYASGQYEVDPSIGQTVRDSAAYAVSIVEQHADEDDCQKLVSYRDEICRLTSYNFTDFSPTDYGDPWQLIWVFDQNLQTNVVCEGYSKAFQYLFNQSTFDNELGCLLITGNVDFGHGPGGHMWNVVSMFNDRNYIVDVTNCDIGSAGSNRLFLIGGTGTPQDGYTVDCGYLYTYDQDALSVWNTEELTLSDHNFRYLPTLAVTGIVDKTYTGEAHMQDLAVMDGSETLTEGEHYTVTYDNNTNATEDTPDVPATVTITGITENGYYGSAIREFQISNSDRTYAIGAEALGGDIVYNSDNDGVQVSSDGEVTISAGFVGEAVITITAGDRNFKTVTRSVPVVVNPIPVEELNITGISDQTYTGEALTQELIVTDGDEILTEGEHYTVTYDNNTNATEDTPDVPATVTITGITGNGYSGSVTREFQIEKASNAITVETADITERYSSSDRTYAIGAEALGGDIVYSSDNEGVQVSSDGEVTISAGFIGEAVITITAGDSNYKTAIRSVPVVVNPTPVEELDITGITALTYTGEPLAQNLIVMDGDNLLTEGVHYAVEYSNNTDATEDAPDMPATITITGISENGYTGSRTEEFQIEKAPNAITVGTAGISNSDRTYAIGAEALGGDIVYNSDNDGVQVSSDGKVTISAGFVGEAVITITAGDRNFKTVTRSVPVVVKLISVEELDITGISDKTYTGEELTQNLIVMDGDDVLTEGVHYTVEYDNNTDATEDTPDAPATVTITGISENGYTGSRTEGFRIEKASNAITVGTASITKAYSTGSRTYTLNATARGGNLTYSSNNNGVQVSSAGKVTIKAGFIGKAIITITAGDSNYKTVTKRVPVVVNPTMTCILSLTSPKAGQMLVTYKKNTVGTGYQIQFSLNKEFSPVTSAWVTSNTTLTRKIGNLQKGQKYYVRIRTYKLVDGVKFYSAWSAIKAIRISK